MLRHIRKLLCLIGIHKYGKCYYAWHPHRVEWQCERCGKKRVWL